MLCPDGLRPELCASTAQPKLSVGPKCDLGRKKKSGQGVYVTVLSPADRQPQGELVPAGEASAWTSRVPSLPSAHAPHLCA